MTDPINRIDMLSQIIDSLITGIDVQQKALTAAVNLIEDLMGFADPETQNHYREQTTRFKQLVTHSNELFAPVKAILQVEKETRNVN